VSFWVLDFLVCCVARDFWKVWRLGLVREAMMSAIERVAEVAGISSGPSEDPVLLVESSFGGPRLSTKAERLSKFPSSSSSSEPERVGSSSNSSPPSLSSTSSSSGDPSA
jgi:hypothetical protein